MTNKTENKKELMPLLEKVIKIQNRADEAMSEIRNSLPILLRFDESLILMKAVEKVVKRGVKLQYAATALHDIVLADSETRDAI